MLCKLRLATLFLFGFGVCQVIYFGCTDGSGSGGTVDLGGSGPEDVTQNGDVDPGGPGGFVAEECVDRNTICTHETACPSGQACNTGVDTGQDGRGVCATLGCGPAGSVCSMDLFCKDELVCNDYYAYDVEPSLVDPLVSEEGIPLKGQCRLPQVGQYCCNDDDCAIDRTGLSCNDRYWPNQCRLNGLGDLCINDYDCEDDLELGHLFCNTGELPCFLGIEKGCEEEPFDNHAANLGYCSPLGDIGAPCMEDGYCLTESEETGKRLRCVRLDDPYYEPYGNDGKCYDPYTGYSDETPCNTGSSGGCGEEGVCGPKPGICYTRSDPGESCTNRSYCWGSYHCINGVCVESTE